MDIIGKINFLIEEKGMSKKEFVERLRLLEPILKSTGEIPSEQTIYRYLNEKRELKVELIPFIAEVLEVDEQELFSINIEYASNNNYHKSREIREIIELLAYTPNSIVIHIRDQLLKYKNLYNETVHKV